MRSVKAKGNPKLQKRHLVQETAANLRDVILAREAGAQIGSLDEVAQLLGVGIVTVQQAARVLEHEGLLAVRRGPGGGYYGTRPDEAALERAFAAYMRVHGVDYRDALEITTLLDCEIIPAAARCKDDDLRKVISALNERIDLCDAPEDRVAFENELRNVLFKFVARPLIELLLRVTKQLYKAQSMVVVFRGQEGVAAWKTGKRRILNAILRQDEELARFEAERYQRQVSLLLRKTKSDEE